MKKLYTLILSCLMCVLCAFALTACGGGDGDGGNGGSNTHTHDYQATAYFDKDSTFAKTLECKNTGCDQKTINYDSIEITTADQLVALNQYMSGNYKFNGSSLTVTIKNNIDMAGKAWTPIDVKVSGAGRFAFTFEGVSEGVTISNLTTSGENAGFFGSVERELTIKNITLKNATVTSEYGYAGAFIGYVNGAKVTVNKCAVENSQITGELAAGALYGCAYKESADNQPVMLDFANVTVKNNTITSAEFAGGFFGIGADAPIGGLQVNVSTFVFDSNTVISNASDALSAGVFVGKVGYSRLAFDPTGSTPLAEIAASSTATSNGTAISADSRVYGRTGWHAGWVKAEVGGLMFGGEITNNPTVD